MRLAGPEDPSWQLLGPRSLDVHDGAYVVTDNRDPDAPERPIDPALGAADGAPTALGNVTLSADGSTVVAQASGDTGPTIVVIDVDSNERWTLPEPAWAFALTPDGKRLVTLTVEPAAAQAAGASSITVWNLTSRSRERSASATELGLDGPSQPTIIDDDGSVLLISQTRIVRAQLPDLDVTASAAIATEAALSGVDDVPATDQVIISTFENDEAGLARIDLATGEVLATGSSAEPDPFVDVVVSGDGSVVAARHVDSGTFEVFDAGTLASITGPFGGLGPVSASSPAPVIDADGTTLAIRGSGRDLMVWDIDPHSWETSACVMAGRNLTRDEWGDFIGPDEPYRATCPQWPAP